MRFTPPVQIVYALDQALTEFFAEGQAAGAIRWSSPLRRPLDRKYAELEARFDR